MNKTDPTLLYSNFDKIGEGFDLPLFSISSFVSAAGVVFLATKNDTGEQVAVKKMQINGDNMKLLCTEISIMKVFLSLSLSHSSSQFLEQHTRVYCAVSR